MVQSILPPGGCATGGRAGDFIQVLWVGFCPEHQCPEKMGLNCSKLQPLYYQRKLYARFGAAKQMFRVAECFKAPLADMVWVAGEDGQCWWWNKQSCAPPFGSVGTQLQLQEGWGYLLYLLFPSAVGSAGGLGLAGPGAHSIQVPFPAHRT